MNMGEWGKEGDIGRDTATEEGRPLRSNINITQHTVNSPLL